MSRLGFNVLLVLGPELLLASQAKLRVPACYICVIPQAAGRARCPPVMRPTIASGQWLSGKQRTTKRLVSQGRQRAMHTERANS